MVFTLPALGHEITGLTSNGNERNFAVLETTSPAERKMLRQLKSINEDQKAAEKKVSDDAAKKATEAERARLDALFKEEKMAEVDKIQKLFDDYKLVGEVTVELGSRAYTPIPIGVYDFGKKEKDIFLTSAEVADIKKKIETEGEEGRGILPALFGVLLNLPLLGEKGDINGAIEKITKAGSNVVFGGKIPDNFSGKNGYLELQKAANDLALKQLFFKSPQLFWGAETETERTVTIYKQTTDGSVKVKFLLDPNNFSDDITETQKVAVIKAQQEVKEMVSKMGIAYYIEPEYKDYLRTLKPQIKKFLGTRHFPEMSKEDQRKFIDSAKTELKFLNETEYDTLIKSASRVVSFIPSVSVRLTVPASFGDTAVQDPAESTTPVDVEVGHETPFGVVPYRQDDAGPLSPTEDSEILKQLRGENKELRTENEQLNQTVTSLRGQVQSSRKTFGGLGAFGGFGLTALLMSYINTVGDPTAVAAPGLQQEQDICSKSTIVENLTNDLAELNDATNFAEQMAKENEALARKLNMTLNETKTNLTSTQAKLTITEQALGKVMANVSNLTMNGHRL